jgi:hypothetical protein
MALFKQLRGKRSDLVTQELHDGYAYFCTDDGTFHIDYVDDNGHLQRKQINANEAQKLIGYDITTVLNSSDTEIPTSKAILDTLDTKVSKEGNSTISGNLSITGDLYVNGVTHTVDTETLTVKDNLIMIEGQNQPLAGIVIDNCETNSDYHNWLLLIDKVSFDTSKSLDFSMIDKINSIQLYIYCKWNGYSVDHLVISPAFRTLSVVIQDENGDFSGRPGLYSKEVYEYGEWKVDSFSLTEISWVYLAGDVEMKDKMLEFANFISINTGEECQVISKNGIFAAPVLVGDTLKIGEGYEERDENGNITSFTFFPNAAQSIATRKDDIKNNALLSWDAVHYTIKD